MGGGSVELYSKGDGVLVAVKCYLFSSHGLEANSRLYAYGFRAYEPNLQRWITRDPLQELGELNLYGFVYNTPTLLVDPWGFIWYDDLRDWARENARCSKSIADNGLPWWLAGALGAGADLGAGLASLPSTLGHLGEATGATGDYLNEPSLQPLVHLGEGAGSFIGDPSVDNAAAFAQDIAAAAAVMAAGLSATEIGNSAIGWKGGEITLTRPNASTPDFRVNLFGNRKNPKNT